MSAVTLRERRSTAGKRMSSLVGKALDDDEAFWGHDTWEEEDSGNDSFRESDEESEARVDEFDSDFDESESDHDAEEEAAGAEEEAQIQREEKNQRRKQKFDIAKAGRDLMQKKKGKGKKRAMGDGMNAGLVLNMPPSLVADVALQNGAPDAVARPPPLPPITAPPKKPKTIRRYSPRSPGGKKRTLRAATVSKSQQAESKRKSASSSTTSTTTSAKKKQKRYTQEELLLEAATVTEPENERWLLARKRVQQTQDELHKTAKEGKSGKVICKFRSRRGCLNSLTFPEMDHVPDILARKHVAPEKRTVPTECVITGKEARYRDPKTMLGYHDIEAFKELRRRFNAGEKLNQRDKKQEAADVDMTMPDDAGERNIDVAAPTTDVADASNDTSSTAKEPESLDIETDKVVDTQGPLAKVTTPALVVGASEVSEPVALATTATSIGRCSPRKRRPSAKAIAAVETVLLSPGKASMSNVIMNLTAPQLEAATVESTASTERAKSMNDSNGDSAAGREVLKRLAESSTTKPAANESGS